MISDVFFYVLLGHGGLEIVHGRHLCLIVHAEPLTKLNTVEGAVFAGPSVLAVRVREVRLLVVEQQLINQCSALNVRTCVILDFELFFEARVIITALISGLLLVIVFAQALVLQNLLLNLI